jgi:hypothetical protein
MHRVRLSAAWSAILGVLYLSAEGGALVSGCTTVKTSRVVGASQRLDSCVSASVNQRLDQAVDCGPACIALVILPCNALPT